MFYQIDSLESIERLAERRKKAIHRLIREATEDIGGWARLGKMLVGLLTFPHSDEISAWADGAGKSINLIKLLNLSYEFSHVIGAVYGCTAAGQNTRDGVVHLRNLDWPLPGIANATQIMTWDLEDRQVVNVGILGYAGILTGMVPGRFSIAMNWGAPDGPPNPYKTRPAGLVREALTYAEDFEDAVAMLEMENIATSAIFSVAGTKKNEFAVIERTKNEAYVRPGTNEVAANHFSEESDWDYLNDDEVKEYSLERENALRKAKKSADISALRSCDNEDTVQKVLMIPRTGEIQLITGRRG